MAEKGDNLQTGKRQSVFGTGTDDERWIQEFSGEKNPPNRILRFCLGRDLISAGTVRYGVPALISSYLKAVYAVQTVFISANHNGGTLCIETFKVSQKYQIAAQQTCRTLFDRSSATDPAVGAYDNHFADPLVSIQHSSSTHSAYRFSAL